MLPNSTEGMVALPTPNLNLTINIIILAIIFLNGFSHKLLEKYELLSTSPDTLIRTVRSYNEPVSCKKPSHWYKPEKKAVFGNRG